MPQKKLCCPKCGEKEAILPLGKRYTMYPVGCVFFLGWFISGLHQLASPLEYRCLKCDHVFGRRTMAGRFGLLLIFLILLFFVALAFL
ncbi:MAG: hypothetical protein AAF733_11545 [Verrucomicrobiota bacterium]